MHTDVTANTARRATHRPRTAVESGIDRASVRARASASTHATQSTQSSTQSLPHCTVFLSPVAFPLHKILTEILRVFRSKSTEYFRGEHERLRARWHVPAFRAIPSCIMSSHLYAHLSSARVRARRAQPRPRSWDAWKRTPRRIGVGRAHGSRERRASSDTRRMVAHGYG